MGVKRSVTCGERSQREDAIRKRRGRKAQAMQSRDSEAHEELCQCCVLTIEEREAGCGKIQDWSAGCVSSGFLGLL